MKIMLASVGVLVLCVIGAARGLPDHAGDGVFHLLADASAGGVKNFTISDWTVFFTLVTTSLASVASSLIAVISAIKAKTSADINTGRISDVSQKVDRQPAEVTEKIKLAMMSPPVVIVPVPDPEKK